MVHPGVSLCLAGTWSEATAVLCSSMVQEFLVRKASWEALGQVGTKEQAACPSSQVRCWGPCPRRHVDRDGGDQSHTAAPWSCGTAGGRVCLRRALVHRAAASLASLCSAVSWDVPRRCTLPTISLVSASFMPDTSQHQLLNSLGDPRGGDYGCLPHMASIPQGPCCPRCFLPGPPIYLSCLSMSQQGWQASVSPYVANASGTRTRAPTQLKIHLLSRKIYMSGVEQE